MFEAIIVVPCFNEAERLPAERFVGFAEQHPEVRFWFVDDGSSDATGERLQALAARRPEAFRCHALASNRGKAEAVREGMRLALAERPQYVGFWDADLATPLESILDFAQFLETHASCEAVFGARVALAGRNIQRQLRRHYSGRVFATLVSWVLGLSIYDTQCGAKMFRCSDTTSSLFEAPFLSRWIFDVEIVARLIRARGADALSGRDSVLAEYPLEEWLDVSGSKLRPGDFAKAAVDLWRIHKHYRVR
ncbi:MAG: glycosyltransferase [Myxococcota bacterium]